VLGIVQNYWVWQHISIGSKDLTESLDNNPEMTKEGAFRVFAHTDARNNHGYERRERKENRRDS